MPLIEVNCAAIPSELIDRTVRHEKEPLLRPSNNELESLSKQMVGLYFDEIGDMSLSAC